MKRKSASIQKDYSFLHNMSTEELQDILRQDFELGKNQSDLDLVMHVMEVLEIRETASGTDMDTDCDSETALESLREKIKRREEVFAELESSEKDKLGHIYSTKPKHLWRRIVGIVAIFILVVVVGISTANATGYDLWGGMVRWTRETFSYGKTVNSIDKNNDNVLFDVKVILEDNGITAPIMPNWLPNQYISEDIQVFKTPESIRITSMETANDSSLFIQVIEYYNDDNSARHFEINGDSVQLYETNGITHYIMRNNNSTRITWARENLQIALEFSEQELDSERIINSIYEE